MMNNTPNPARVASRMMAHLGLDVSAPDPGRVASRMNRTAGEVRFIKDKSGDASQWAWNDSGPQERKITPDFAFDPRNTKPLAEVLRATVAALGHGMRAYTIFTKIKSADVSPDGSLGGKGYIQKIAEMRRGYMNVVEAMSALSDTLYDEIRAPHWAAVSRQEDPQEKAEVEQIVGDALDIKKDPEEWAKNEEEQMGDTPDAGVKKKTSKKALYSQPRISPSDFGFPIKLINQMMSTLRDAPFNQCVPTHSKEAPFENDTGWVLDCLKASKMLLSSISRPNQLPLVEGHLKRAMMYAWHNAEQQEIVSEHGAGRCSPMAWGQIQSDLRFILDNLYPKYPPAR